MGAVFLVPKDNIRQKSGVAIPLGMVCGLAEVLVEQPTHLSVASPVGKAY